MMSRMPSIARCVFALLALGIGGGLLAAAGCSSVLGLDGLDSGGQSLCDVLGHCTSKIDAASCGDRVDGVLAGLVPSRQTKWLHELEDKNCLDTCNKARKCLDRSPICGARGTPCGAREECCGFAQGTSDCDPHAGVCCSRQGVRCNGDADCCTGAGACEPTTGTCGGVICNLAGAACANGFECCSGICDAVSNTCSAEACFDDGFECSADADCCSKTCDAGAGKCVTPSCAVVGTDCDPAVENACCSGLWCVASEGQRGVCSTKQECFPDQYDCSVDEQCCSGVCSKKFHLCGQKCGAAKSPCKTAVDCCEGSCVDGKCDPCSQTVCVPGSEKADETCCPGKSGGAAVECVLAGPSVKGLCKESCKGTCEHDVCESGAALDPACPADSACITAVCAIDFYCCCVGWDELCQNAVGAAPECDRNCVL